MISHKGLVLEARGGIIKVRLLSEGACGSCAASGLCGKASQEDKTVEVRAREGLYKPGDEVELVLGRGQSWRALLFSFLLPLSLLMIILLYLLRCGLSELAASGAALAALALYYLLLYLLRGRLASGYEFRIKQSL